MLSIEQINQIRQSSGYKPISTSGEVQTSLTDELGIKQPVTQTETQKTGDTGVKGVATGFAKGLLEGTIGTSRALQSAGQGILAAVDPTRTYSEIREQTGFKSLQGEQAKSIDETLKAKSTAEKAGKALEFVAEVVTPAGITKEGIAAVQKGKQILGTGEKIFTNILEKRAVNKALTKSEKAFEEALDISRPKITQKLEQQAFEEGRVGKQKLFKGAKITPSSQEIQIAESIQPLIERGDLSTKLFRTNPSEAKKVIDTEVSRINEGVKNFVADNKVPFNTKQLKSQLNTGKEDLKLIFASDTNAENTYNAVSEAFLNHVKSKDTVGLLKARQSFDKIPAIKKLLDSDKLGENARKEIVLAVRRSANDYISNLLPKGNPFKSLLKKESKMIEASDNLATKIKGITQQGKIESFLSTPRGKIIKKSAIGTGIVGGSIGGASAIFGQ